MADLARVSVILVKRWERRLTIGRLGDVINRFRASIDLATVPGTEGPSLAEALEIPFTYCWSPALVPKPRDWPSHIGMYAERFHRGRKS